MANDVIQSSAGEIAPAAPGDRLLTREEFHTLKSVPPETEWFAGIDSPNTKRAYQHDVEEFIRFLGIQSRQRHCRYCVQPECYHPFLLVP